MREHQILVENVHEADERISEFHHVEYRRGRRIKKYGYETWTCARFGLLCARHHAYRPATCFGITQPGRLQISQISRCRLRCFAEIGRGRQGHLRAGHRVALRREQDVDFVVIDQSPPEIDIGDQQQRQTDADPQMHIEPKPAKRCRARFRHCGAL